MSIEKAKDVILDRIAIEVFLGHNAIAVYMALSDHSQALNALPFHQALGTIQRHALDAFILCLCKLYEKPDHRYPNFSIPTTIHMLQEGISNLTVGVQNGVRLDQFVKKYIDPAFTAEAPGNISRLPALILDHFTDLCPRTPPRKGKELDLVLDALKVLRDKRVAHNEDSDLSSLSKTDLDGALRLLAFAQTYVNLVGYGFFGFSQEGEVEADRFDPNKSVVWPELNRMIGLLEQSKSSGPSKQPPLICDDKEEISMPNNMTKNWGRIVAIILSLFAFCAFTPGAAKQWYQIGTGLSYDKELKIAGITHQQSTALESHDERVDRAKRNGTIYAASMVSGTHLPLLSFLLLTVIIITIPLSKGVNKKLFMLFPVFLIWGIAFSGFAHLMISSLPLTDALLGASVIWVGFTAIFGLVLFVGLFIRKEMARRRYSS